MNALITARFFDIRTATTTNRWLHWLLFCGVAGVPEQTYQAYSSATVLKAKIQLWGQPKQYMLGVLYHFTLCMPMHDNHLNNILRLDHLGWPEHSLLQVRVLGLGHAGGARLATIYKLTAKITKLTQNNARCACEASLFQVGPEV